MYRGVATHKKLKLLSKEIDLIAYDFDGVMTDNKVYVFEKGTEAVRCSRADGLGINIIKTYGMAQLIISTESNPVVEARAKKVNIPVIYNCKNKLLALKSFCEQKGYDMSKVIYVGNDTNDLDVMNAVGIPVCPSDAHHSVLQIASIVLETKGGDGVVRELSEVFEY